MIPLHARIFPYASPSSLLMKCVVGWKPFYLTIPNVIKSLIEVRRKDQEWELKVQITKPITWPNYVRNEILANLNLI